MITSEISSKEQYSPIEAPLDTIFDHIGVEQKGMDHEQSFFKPWI
jgi:hypothetical protein